MKEELTVKEFAKALGVSHDTVTRWVKAEKIKGYRRGWLIGKTTPIVIPASELTRLLKLQKKSAGK